MLIHLCFYCCASIAFIYLLCHCATGTKHILTLGKYNCIRVSGNWSLRLVQNTE